MASVSLVHWTYHKNKKGLSPVKINVCHNDYRRVFTVRLPGHGKNLYMSEKEFKEASRFRSKVGQQLKAELRRAENALPVPFDETEFESNYLNEGKGFYEYYEEYLKEYKEKQPGTYKSYNNALSKWKSVYPNDFQPRQLFQRLDKYEKACNTTTTAGFYLRATKRIYNLIRTELRNLPEWRKRINSKSGTHKGRRIPVEELQAFIDFPNLTKAQDEARRIFMISCYTGGMNMLDLLKLKWSDVKEDRIIFVREKTKNTDGSERHIPILDELRHYLGKPGDSQYIIPNFNRKGDELQIRQRAKNFTKNLNSRIKAACKSIGIDPFTSYSARHSIATLMFQNGVPIPVISQWLGHGSVRTTEIYLGKLDLNTMRDGMLSVPLTVNKQSNITP